MNKIVRKEGKIYDVWSNDGSFRHTTWRIIGEYDENKALGEDISNEVDNVSADDEKKPQRRKNKRK